MTLFSIIAAAHGTVGVPILLFVVLGRVLGPRARSSPEVRAVSLDLPILASVLTAASAVLSPVAIIAIYREGGILKRLRATPLRPHTILAAHVLVKLWSSSPRQARSGRWIRRS